MIKRTNKLKNPNAALARQTELKPTKSEAPVVVAAPKSIEAPKPIAPPPSAPTRMQNSKPTRVALDFVKPEAKSVCVAGSFNGWKPDSTPLAKQGNGHWVGDLNVGPGRYEYLFVVDGQWLPDPNAKEAVQNPFGGKNSVLLVG